MQQDIHYFSRPKRKNKQLALTSLIDVVFLLIVFFMVSSSYHKISAVELSIPAGKQDNANLSDSTIIYINPDGKVRLWGDYVSDELLVYSLKSLFEYEPDSPVRVVAHPNINVQKVVDVVDYIYRSGGRNVSISQLATDD